MADNLDLIGVWGKCKYIESTSIESENAIQPPLVNKFVLGFLNEGGRDVDIAKIEIRGFESPSERPPYWD
jgi:hypothetical protein|tara:strand:- start:8742 stop:8951 length:210 start_codon:yes stop_codon:yes gene_type:complete